MIRLPSTPATAPPSRAPSTARRVTLGMLNEGHESERTDGPAVRQSRPDRPSIPIRTTEELNSYGSSASRAEPLAPDLISNKDKESSLGLWKVWATAADLSPPLHRPRPARRLSKGCGQPLAQAVRIADFPRAVVHIPALSTGLRHIRRPEFLPDRCLTTAPSSLSVPKDCRGQNTKSHASTGRHGMSG